MSVFFVFLSGLIADICAFVDNCSIEYFNEETTNLIDAARADNTSINDIAKDWEKLMREVS